MKKNYFEEFYGRYGKEYSELRIKEGSLFNEFIEKPALMESLLNETLAGKYVLDVGCGPGMYSLEAATLGGKVTAIDLSMNMLDIARNHCKNNLSKNIFEAIDFVHIDFIKYTPSFQFDIIIATFMPSYFSCLDSFFCHARKMVKNDGKLFVSVIHPIKKIIDNYKSGGDSMDYFGKREIKTDLGLNFEDLNLYNWTFQDFSKKSRKYGFLIDEIIEPKPTTSCPKHMKLKMDFFTRIPSVLIVKYILK